MLGETGLSAHPHAVLLQRTHTQHLHETCRFLEKHRIVPRDHPIEFACFAALFKPLLGPTQHVPLYLTQRHKVTARVSTISTYHLPTISLSS